MVSPELYRILFNTKEQVRESFYYDWGICDIQDEAWEIFNDWNSRFKYIQEQILERYRIHNGRIPTICWGFAFQTKRVLNKYGVKSELIFGEGHAWTCFWYNGQYYEIDFTPSPNDYSYTGGSERIRYGEYIKIYKKMNDYYSPFYRGGGDAIYEKDYPYYKQAFEYVYTKLLDERGY
ncbi:hypothetical protein AGMMS50212_14040 [Spirochaetia bacterium]|nr:hypothetical protein AGMMS50212_14040 [Spirochaetia bacterium]